MRQIDGGDSYLKRFPLLCASCVVSVLFGILLILITPIFETVDDTCMKAIVSGVLICPEPSARTIFMNETIGWCLKSLYEVSPRVPWYAIGELSVHFVAHVTLLWAFLLVMPARRTVVIFSVYLIAVGSHLISHLSFTTTAFLAIQSGIALLIGQMVFHRGHNTTSLFRLVAAVCLILIGSMIRFQVFMLLGLVSVPFLVSVCHAAWLRQLTIQTYHGAMTVLLLLGLAYGIAWRDGQVFVHAPGWESTRDLLGQIYRTADLASSTVLESHPEEAAEILHSVGWSRNDFFVMKSWFLFDDQTYSHDRLKSFADQWERLDANSPRQNFIKILAAILAVVQSRICMACCLVAWLVAPYRSSGTMIWGYRITWGLACSILLGLAWMHKLPERVYLPVIVFSAMLSVWFHLLATTRNAASSEARISEVRSSRIWKWTGVLIVVGVCVSSLVNDVMRQARVWKQYQRLEADLKWAASQEHRVLVILSGFPYECLLPWDDFRTLREVRPVMSGLYARTPHMPELSRFYGLTDLLTSISSEAGCYIAADVSGIEMLDRFLKEHFDTPRRFKKIYQAQSGFAVYEVVPGLVKSR